MSGIIRVTPAELDAMALVIIMSQGKLHHKLVV